MGKNIKKTSLHQLKNVSKSQLPEPTVYKINKGDIKDFVQQTIGSPNHPADKPPNHTPKPNITRLQKIRPPSLSLVRPAVPVSISFPISASMSIPTTPKAPPPGIIDFPGLPDGFKIPSPIPIPLQPSTVSLPWDMSTATNIVESPISAYVRQLLEDPDSNGDQFQLQQQVPSSVLPQPQHHSLSLLHPHTSNVIAPLVSENVTITTNPIVSVNASNSVQFEPYGTTMNVNVTTNSLMHVNVSSNGNLLEPNGIPIAPSSPNSLMDVPLPSPQSPNRPLFPIDIPFPSPQSPYGSLFPTEIHLPSPPSPPLFPPDFQFPSPQSPYGPLLPPDDVPPPFSPSTFFPMSPSGFFPMSPWTPGQI